MKQAIFLDRDGVINKVIVRGPAWIGSPRELHEWEWMSGIHEGVARLHEAGYLIIVVTNQPEIARNQTTPAQLDAMHAHMRKELKYLDDVLACIHDNDHNCLCRKPRPGLLLEAAKKWDIDLKNSWILGDRDKDILAGKAAGCKTCLIQNEYHYLCEPDAICKSVLEFATTIIP